MALERLLAQLRDPSDLGWKDETYDLADARSLSPEARAIYAAQLVEAGQAGDARALLTLGYLGMRDALPLLRAEAASARPTAGVARRALVLLGHGDEVWEAIVHDAVHAPRKMDRVAAILDLPTRGGQSAIAALVAALDDEDDDVRLIAWDALIVTLGLKHAIENAQGVRELTTEVEVMRVLLGSPIAALVDVGAKTMRRIAQELAAGATPAALGIAWQPPARNDVLDAIREAMYDREVPYPVDQVAALSGVWRQLAETIIVRRLEDDDPRVPEVLVQLGARWTAPALAALADADETAAELRPVLAAAATRLGARRPVGGCEG